MIPTSEGVWRWARKDDGREFDLPVYNLGQRLGVSVALYVNFLGKYYEIDAFSEGTWLAKTDHNPDGYITKQISGWIHPEDWKTAA